MFWNKIPTFDPESKSAKISKILLCKQGRGWEGGGWADYVRQLVRIWGELQGSETNFQLLILSLNLLKTKIPYVS